MKRQPFFLRLLLTLLLLASQQMGLVHAIGHLSDPDGREPQSQLKRQPTPQSKQLPADKACQQCLAFAQIDAAVDTPPYAFIAPPLEQGIELASLARSATPTTDCPFHSRAPPACL